MFFLFFFFPRKRCSAVTSERSARQRVLSPPRPPLRQRVRAHPPGPGWSCGLRRRRQQQQRAVPRDITPELQPRSELPAFLGLVGWLRWRSQDPPAAGRAAPPARGGESPRKSRGEERVGARSDGSAQELQHEIHLCLLLAASLSCTGLQRWVSTESGFARSSRVCWLFAFLHSELSGEIIPAAACTGVASLEQIAPLILIPPDPLEETESSCF